MKVDNEDIKIETDYLDPGHHPNVYTKGSGLIEKFLQFKNQYSRTYVIKSKNTYKNEFSDKKKGDRQAEIMNYYLTQPVIEVEQHIKF